MNGVITSFSFLLFAFLLISCNNSTKAEKDTPVSGSIVIMADESFYPIVKAEIGVFESLYPNARIIPEYKSQNEAIRDFLNGKAEVILTGRELNEDEKAFIKKKNISLVTSKVATDAIAFLVNDKISDSLFTTGQLKKILSGEVRRWNELVPHLPDQDIEIVIDKSSSGNLDFLQQNLSLKTEAVKIFAAGSNQKVIANIQNNTAGLGIIGANWISDEDDPDLESKLQGIKVLAFADEEKDPDKFCQPLQTHLADDSYPLTRPLFLIYKNTGVGLGTGFASFVLSDRGQRIILKAGLVPENMPGREIYIKRNNL